MWCQNIRSASFSFVTIHASDGRTDGQTELRQQYRALHYMPHGKIAIDNVAVFSDTIVTPNSSWSPCDGAWPRLTASPLPTTGEHHQAGAGRQPPYLRLGRHGTGPPQRQAGGLVVRSCCSILFEVNARPLLINCVPDRDRQADRRTDR